MPTSNIPWREVNRTTRIYTAPGSIDLGLAGYHCFTATPKQLAQKSRSPLGAQLAEVGGVSNYATFPGPCDLQVVLRAGASWDIGVHLSILKILGDM